MRNAIRLVAVAVTLLAAIPALASNLVTAEWLSKNLTNPEVLLLDANPMHPKGHIPGAVPVNVMIVASFGVRDVPTAMLEKVYQTAGISAGRKIVIYDEGGSWFAPRLFFALEYHGFPVKDMVILDGGLAKWRALNLPVTTDATPAPAAGTFRIAKQNEDVRSRIPEMLAAAGEPGSKVLLDAMGPEYHYGGTAFFNKAGHIPNAVMLPSEDFFNADKTFKSPEEIRRMAAFMNVKPDQEIHAHCGGGGAAAVPYFALKHLGGYSKTKLSVESQMGWLQDDRDLPFWTYGTPSLMRETDWLSSWGGKMMRMYGVSRVSVVDVRPAAAYAQGHVPFAISVPGETVRSHLADPSKFAEVLGASGVNPAHEAIVVSGSGITKDAALAFVMLEKLGQKKVSIYTDSLESMDSLDKLSRRGFAVTKDPTKLPVVNYTVNPRAGVTADAKGAKSANPKVYIASGASVPAKAPDGKVVHVPYTSLLNADGTPKPAKDIWATLNKAGVPRYAELVTFSDDPGEAAVNYFVLRLMGFPEAKVAI